MYQLPGVQFGVPYLGSHSLDDIVSLRLNEDVFYTVRTALVDLQQACLQEGVIDDWVAYQCKVEEQAMDIVGPAHDVLQKQLKRRKIWTLLASSISSTLTKLTIRGAASLAGLPPVGAAAGPAGTAVGNAIKRGRSSRDLEVACSLLVGLLDPE